MANKSIQFQIVTDAIQHIIDNNIEPLGGIYFFATTQKEFKNKNLQSLLPKFNKCNTCQLGALFYSTVNSRNNFQLSLFHYDNLNNDQEINLNGSDVYPFLLNYFNRRTLYLADCYFETFSAVDEYDLASVIEENETLDFELLADYPEDETQIIINFAILVAIQNDEILRHEHFKYVANKFDSLTSETCSISTIVSKLYSQLINE